MTRAWWFALWIALALLVAIAALAAGLLIWVLPQFDGLVTINGRALQLGPLHGGHWLLITLGLLLAMIALLVVLPLALLASLLVPALALLAGLLAMTLGFTLMLSPLLLIGWLVWRSQRGKRRQFAP